LFTYNFLNIQK